MCSLLREMNVKYQHVDDKRMEGLRALARMIATAHMRRLRDTERAQGQYAGSPNVHQCEEPSASPPKAKTERRRD